MHQSEVALAELSPEVDERIRAQLIIGSARALWACGNIEFHMARFDQALSRIEKSLALCERAGEAARYMDLNPTVMCICYRAWYEWESGDSDLAVTSVRNAVHRGKSSGRALSIALALSFQVAIALFRGEYRHALTLASESISISENSQYNIWYAGALVLRGRARAEFTEERTCGLDEITQGLRLWADTGCTVTRPFLLSQLAEACARDRQYARGLKAIEEALQIIDCHGDRYDESTVVRVHACLLEHLQPCVASRSTVVQHLQYAYRLAEQHQ